MQTLINVNSPRISFSYVDHYLQNHIFNNQNIKDYFGIKGQLYTYEVENWMHIAYPWIQPSETMIFKKADISELKDGDRVLLMNIKKGFIIPRHVIRKGNQLVFKEHGREFTSIPLNSKTYELLGVIMTNDNHRFIDGVLRVYIDVV